MERECVLPFGKNATYGEGWFETAPAGSGFRSFLFLAKSGAPGETRTPDPLVRSQMLYPAELRARRGIITAKANLRLGDQYTIERNVLGAAYLSSRAVLLCDRSPWFLVSEFPFIQPAAWWRLIPECQF